MIRKRVGGEYEKRGKSSLKEEGERNREEENQEQR